ncbi:MAG: glycoside hydrolase family 16 protein [Clostridiales bacterium]|nr:glycoside hydrolase family 16 protein [Clostridiales bacterium]
MNFWANDFLGMAANIATALVSAILLLFNVVSVSGKPETLNIEDFTLVFEDEFDGDSLDRDIWHIHNHKGVRKGGFWTLNNTAVSGGNLTITTEYLPGGEFGPGWYTAGISTADTFSHTYGYYECRCILPKGYGLWSAFWLTNPNAGKVSGSGKNGAELDIFESPFYFLGGKRSYKVTSNIHYNGYELNTRYKNVCIAQLDNNPYENFNTYGLLWTEDEYIFYVNGRETRRTSYGGVSQVPEYLILSCEVDGAAAKPTFGWSGHARTNTDSNDNYKGEFIVDYVRVYDKN